MIEQKTLFVLGAGASMPYGFPSGHRLRELLAYKQGHYGEMRQTLLEGFGISYDDLDHFLDTFLKSRQNSIDTFLAKRTDLARIGKLAIAFQLYMAEAKQQLHIPEDKTDDWLSHLWQPLQHDIHAPEDILKNAVRFITFNYDRTLECFLFDALRHSFLDCPNERAMEVMEEIPILHVYGSLGKFGPSQTATTAPYPPRIDNQALQLAADTLRVIPEARDNDPCFSTAQEWFYWSDRICFLGFGFDQLNMKRLALNEVLSDLSMKGLQRPKIYASVLGLEELEIRQNVLPYFSEAKNFPQLNVGDAMRSAKNLQLLRKVNLLR